MKSTLLRWKQILVAALVLVFLPVPAIADWPFLPRPVTVMTQNLYLGADLTPLLTSADINQLRSRVADAWQQIQETDFRQRAKALATEIAAKRPDLIGLQEVALYRIQWPGDFFDGNTPATFVVLDFLWSLLKELYARGLFYTVAATSTNLDIEVPSATGVDIRFTDRDVILARAGLWLTGTTLSNPQNGNFVSKLHLSVAGFQVDILRGWAAIDVNMPGKTFRFVNTHLEAFNSLVQLAQANELVQGPGNTNLPLVLAGDFNSPPGDPTYKSLTDPAPAGAGLHDAWDPVANGPGFTCCQAEDLSNFPSSLNTRIDLVLFRGAFTVLGVDVVGEDLADRTPSNLWPSDHAGVVAKLRLD